MRRALLALVLLSLPASSWAAKPVYMWMFFVTGTTPASKYEKAEVEKMQAAHLANLGRLYSEGKLLVAGPCADPEKRKRGIVLLKLNSKDEFKTCFGSDPYVQNGLMGIESAEMTGDVSRIRKATEPVEMGKCSLVLIRRGAKWSDKGLKRGRGFEVKFEKDDQGPAMFGWLKDGGETLGIALFSSPNMDEVAAVLKRDPRVVSELLRVDVIQQFMAKGVLDGK